MLLAIHELAHAYQLESKMIKQSNWLSEFLCNVMLHTYIAEKSVKDLPALNLFPAGIVKSIDPASLNFTKLQDFDLYYDSIARKHPMNYGWYQCNFHIEAGRIYDENGPSIMMKLWNKLLNQKEQLSSEALENLFSNELPMIKKFIIEWNENFL